jgi:hypothetical protein
MRVLPKESLGRGQAVCLQPMQEDVLLLCGVPETGLEAAQEDLLGQLSMLLWHTTQHHQHQQQRGSGIQYVARLPV